MPGIIKGTYGSYVYVNRFDTDAPVMKTVRGKRPDKMTELLNRNDRNAITSAAVEKMLAETLEAKSDDLLDDDEESAEAKKAAISAEEARIEREKLIAEYEEIRSKYERESEEFVMRAREKATEIYDKTKELAQQTINEAHSEAEEIIKKAKEESVKIADDARQKGTEEGEKKGYDEGYVKALKKCKETLLELKSLSEAVTEAKSDMLMQYERQLFDTIFEICSRVTLGVLGQKEKGLITRMIREAGKKYKTCKNVKLTLSRLDVSEEAEIDEELLKDVFKNCENVEIEILDDAPAGTLMIDDGGEITDASVMTQLKMVEQLGKGKYRDKSLGDMLQENRSETTAKPKRGRKKAVPKEEEVFDDDSPIPDVIYRKGDDDDDIEKQIENS